MMNDDRFDQLLESVRETPEAMPAEAKARVWERLEAEAGTPPVCAQFRAELPGYRQGTLLESRRLLVEDHLSRCVECRRLLAGQSTATVVEMPLGARRALPAWLAKGAIAAGVAAMAIYAGRDRIDAALAPGGARATVEMVAGELRGANGQVLLRGAALQEGDVVRTAAGSRAVLRLADGSALEMNQQAALAVHAAWSGQTVQLESGDVILQAAKQRRGRLRVRTRDAVASVKGTIFAVSTGLAGSLVAVAEGAVEVEQGASQAMLKPGERKASTQALERVSPQEAFAWSQDAGKYLALLGDFAKIEQKVALAPQNSRREARLLPSLPAQPLVYGAVPNIGASLRQAVEDQLRQSAALREWWESAQGREVRRLLDTVTTVTPHLGEEVVFVLAGVPSAASSHLPLVMAEVKTGQRATLEESLKRALAGATDVSYRVTDRLLLVSQSAAHLNAAVAQMGQGAGTAFAQEIARRYQRGAGWMLAVNAEAMMTNAPAVLLEQGVRHVFFEQRADASGDQNEAAMTFNGARRSIASWLGAPAAAASAEYVSSDALMAFSGVTKNPRAAFDDFLGLMGRVQPDFVPELRKFEAMTGVRLADDVAAALGADFAFAIENAALPAPGWTLAMEVTRPTALDGAVRRFVDAYNQQVGATNAAVRVTFAQETANGRAWNVLKSGTVALYWTYDRGYLVASMDRAVAVKALATRNGGFPLVRSARFREQLPVANTVHQSGFVWVNATGAVAQLAGVVPGLKAFAEGRGPVLVTLQGETERMVASSRTRLTSLLVDLAMTAGAEGAGKKAKVAEEE
jgi:hypothetical protein